MKNTELPKKAIILAGGEGTRLRPLTLSIPKALIPIQGKTMTEHLLDLFKKYSITDIIISIGYLKEKIKEYFEDGSKFGLKIEYIEENEPLGTAGGLRLINDKPKEAIIVTNGDELKDVNIAEMYGLHRKNNAMATLLLVAVNDVSRYGIVKIEGSKILEFVEKPAPEKAPSNLASGGFYILEPEVFDMIPEGFAMFEKDIFPLIAKKRRLYGYIHKGQWYDTGTPERYETAQRKWKGLSVQSSKTAQETPL